MPWICPSCGFSDNHDSTVRCLCGHEIFIDEEPIYLKSGGSVDTKPESVSNWTWEHFVAGFLISFLVGFIHILFDFFDSNRFSWSGFGTVFIICLGIGLLAGFFGQKFIQFLLELITKA